MKMLHVRRATRVLRVIWNAEYDGGIHFRFRPRKGQSKVKLGQKRLNLQNQYFLLKMSILSSFVSGFQKNVFQFIFTYGN